MAAKKNTFAQAELARKKASAISLDSLGALERLSGAPDRKPSFLLVDNEESVVQDWRDTLATQALLRKHADFHIFLILEPGQQSTITGIQAGQIEELIKLINEKTKDGKSFDGFFID